MLNIGSLLLGLIAWIVPILAIRGEVKDKHEKSYKYIIISFSACITALCLQMFEINHRVQTRDWSALMDTMGTLLWVSVILSMITLIINIFVLRLLYKRHRK